MKKILYSKIIKFFLKVCLLPFYKPRYLKGKYFDEKRMGWLWAIKFVPHRIFSLPKSTPPWPINSRTVVTGSKNIFFHPSSINVFQTPGCYWQAHDGEIHIGQNCFVAPNVGIITTNHDLYNVSKHQKGKDIIIGNNCWIGMNSVILPGVKLGNNTVVGAGSIVTKSFEDGFVVIGGNPAKVLKTLGE